MYKNTVRREITFENVQELKQKVLSGEKVTYGEWMILSNIASVGVKSDNDLSPIDKAIRAAANNKERMGWTPFGVDRKGTITLELRWGDYVQAVADEEAKQRASSSAPIEAVKPVRHLSRALSFMGPKVMKIEAVQENYSRLAAEFAMQFPDEKDQQKGEAKEVKALLYKLNDVVRFYDYLERKSDTPEVAFKTLRQEGEKLIKEIEAKMQLIQEVRRSVSTSSTMTEESPPSTPITSSSPTKHPGRS